MRYHGCKMARHVSDTYEMCNCFILSCYTNVLINRNIHFAKIYLRIMKLQQKFTLFWIFPRIWYKTLKKKKNFFSGTDGPISPIFVCNIRESGPSYCE